MLAEQLQHGLVVLGTALDHAFDNAGSRLIDNGRFQGDACGLPVELVFGEVRQRRDRAFHIDGQLHTAISSMDALLNVGAFASARFFEELGHIMAERLQLLPLVGQVQASLDAVLLPILAVGLRLEGQMQLDVTEQVITGVKHPQRLFARVTTGKSIQRLLIRSARRMKFIAGQIVGQQMHASQVVMPKVQVLPKRGHFVVGHAVGTHRRMQRFDGRIDHGRQGLGRAIPVNGQAGGNRMRVRELAQRGHRDMAQKVGWRKDFQSDGSSLVLAHKANQDAKNLELAVGPNHWVIRIGRQQVISVFVSCKCF